MARSYRKTFIYRNDEFGPPQWPAFRIKEKRCILDETHSFEYGEVVFPRYYRTSRIGYKYDSTESHYSVKEIRDEYFDEIDSILNGFKTLYHDYQRDFFREYYRIKSGKDENGKGYCFRWLKPRVVKEAIKKWNGDPLDVLYYLNRTGLIEKVVRIEAKIWLRKERVLPAGWFS